VLGLLRRLLLGLLRLLLLGLLLQLLCSPSALPRGIVKFGEATQRAGLLLLFLLPLLLWAAAAGSAGMA
jgi:hypothetical protein